MPDSNSFWGCIDEQYKFPSLMEPIVKLYTGLRIRSDQDRSQCLKRSAYKQTELP